MYFVPSAFLDDIFVCSVSALEVSTIVIPLKLTRSLRHVVPPAYQAMAIDEHMTTAAPLLRSVFNASVEATIKDLSTTLRFVDHVVPVPDDENETT